MDLFGANSYLRYYAHFSHAAGGQALAKSDSTGIAKTDSSSCLDSQTYDVGSQITAIVALALQKWA